MEDGESRGGPISAGCDGWSGDCGRDFGRIVAIWKGARRASGLALVGNPPLIGI
jgi:hypothetical protein